MSGNGGSVLEATFTTNAGAPRAARAALAHLRGELDNELVRRVESLVSEAVTNRVLDQVIGGGRGRVHLQFETDERALRGTVTDIDFDDDRPPGSASAAPRDLEAGMMGALADSWGTIRRADGRIAIWFEVQRRGSPTVEEYAERFAAVVVARDEERRLKA